MGSSTNRMNLSRFFNDNSTVKDDLSPVSVLRLNFDRLPTETTDPVTLTKNVFGVPVPEFVPDKILSWIDNSNGELQQNQPDTLHRFNVLATDNAICRSDELSNSIVIQNVCHIHNFVSLVFSERNLAWFPVYFTEQFNNLMLFYFHV